MRPSRQMHFPFLFVLNHINVRPKIILFHSHIDFQGNTKPCKERQLSSINNSLVSREIATYQMGH